MGGVIYLTADQVLDLHAEVLALGGSPGLRSVHLLHSAIAQAEQTVFGEHAYGTIPEKAAAYGFLIAMNHPVSRRPSDGTIPRGESARDGG